MEQNLWTLRIKSFFISLGTLVGAGVIAALSTDQFMVIVREFTGETIWGTLAVLVLPEIVKHFRNKLVLGRAMKMGSLRTQTSKPFILI